MAATRVIHRLPIAKAANGFKRLAQRAHLKNEYFIFEKNGVPVAGLLDAEELEDYLELRDGAVRRQIRESNRDIREGRIRPASELLAELRRERKAKGRSAHSRQK